MTQMVAFMFGAGGLIACSLAVVFSKSPLRAALYLIGALGCSALLYVMLDAPFVAAMQVLVYAGAIMVLFVFVIMLLDLGPQVTTPWAMGELSLFKILGVLSVMYAGYRVIDVMRRVVIGPGQAVDGSVKHIGVLLMTDYLFGFEAISLLLLVAVVGAVVLGLKRLT